MCRDNDHGGRRCPHDTSEARQSRRVRSKVRSEFASEMQPAPVGYTRANATPKASPVAVITPESAAKSALEAFRQASAHLSADMPKQRFDSPLNSSEIETEHRLIELGIAVQNLAATYDMPTEEEFAALNENAMAVRAAAKAELAAMGTKLQELKRIIRSNSVPSRLDIAKKAVEEHNAIVKQYNALTKKSVKDTSAVGDKAYAALIARRGNAYRKALEAIGVEFAKPEDLNYHMSAALPKLRKNIAQAATFYPRDWVRNAQQIDRRRGALKIEQNGARPGYFPSINSMHVKTADLETVVHELGHYLEGGNANIGESERAFLNRRSGWLSHHRDGDRRPFRTSLRRRGSAEQAYADGFPNAYSGKIYELTARDTDQRGFYEILTVGMESLFFGNHGGNVGYADHRVDHDYTHFILGLFASSSHGSKA